MNETETIYKTQPPTTEDLRRIDQRIERLQRRLRATQWIALAAGVCITALLVLRYAPF